MDRLTQNKLILVTRKTRLQELIARFNTRSQAQFYVEHLGADFSDYINEDEVYRQAVSEICDVLNQYGLLQVVDRSFLPNFIFGEKDLVIAVGQDGLVANTLKYLTSQLLLGVNPDPARWDGILLPFAVGDVRKVIPEVFKNKRPVKDVTMAKATLNDGQSLYAVNDLFIGQKTHVSARYEIELRDRRERQSSSGIIVSTGLGSTGWFKSIMLGAANIVKSTSKINISTKPHDGLSWDLDHLFFSVREPFPSNTSQTGLVIGTITRDFPLKVLSQMPENGVIFSDGIENDFLSFNSGIEATITVAEKRGYLVV